MEVSEIKAWVDKFLGTMSMVKGYEYYREKRIIDFKETEKEDQIVIRASCKGNSSENYVVWASIKDLNSIIQSYCSCHVGSNGTCKHVAALLFTWKLSNVKGDDITSQFTSTELSRKLYPGPFSATLIDTPKSSTTKSPSKYNKSPCKKKSPRNVNRHQSRVSKLDIFGFEDDEDKEKIKLKNENENLKRELENLRTQNDVLKEKMEKILSCNDYESLFDYNNKRIKRKQTTNDDYSEFLFINDNEIMKSPSKRIKDDESPVDRAIKILFNDDDDYRQVNIPFQSNSSQELLSM